MENCVKLVKRILYGSIGSLILDYFDFEFLMQQPNHLVNRRPVAFKNSLRDNSAGCEMPSAITPGLLLKWYELVSANLIPGLHPRDHLDPTWDFANDENHI